MNSILSNEEIKRVLLECGYTIKEGQADLKPYVYDGAKKLIELIMGKLLLINAASTKTPGQIAYDVFQRRAGGPPWCRLLAAEVEDWELVAAAVQTAAAQTAGNVRPLVLGDVSRCVDVAVRTMDYSIVFAIDEANKGCWRACRNGKPGNAQISGPRSGSAASDC